MKKICACGHFGFGENLLNGQTIKTKIVTQELERQFGKNEVIKIDTRGGIKAILKLPFQTFCAMKNCKNIIIFPAHNGLRIITPLLIFEKIFYNRSLHYVVIGGWLPEFLKKRKILKKQLHKFKGIYVETNIMKEALEQQGFRNVIVMPNCKDLHVLDETELVYNTAEPYRLCTFSRVMEEKGIADAVEVVKEVNEFYHRTVYTLDIYGQVDNQQSKWFDNLRKNFPSYIAYRGAIPFDKSTEVLKHYFALLFPTRFYTEGIPGTVIDAYAAGIPVIASKWESFADVIDNKITGLGYQFSDNENLKSLLINIAATPNQINEIKRNCLAKAEAFTPEKAVSILLRGGGITTYTP